MEKEKWDAGRAWTGFEIRNIWNMKHTVDMLELWCIDRSTFFS